jgi:hypothetical protein
MGVCAAGTTMRKWDIVEIKKCSHDSECEDNSGKVGNSTKIVCREGSTGQESATPVAGNKTGVCIKLA